jgi:ABC-type multidrug transport system ATPase subunit
LNTVDALILLFALTCFLLLQFDEQQPELTVRETVTFSAKLRLERSDPAVTPESTEAFITQTLRMLELIDIEDLQVRPVVARVTIQ